MRYFVSVALVLAPALATAPRAAAQDTKVFEASSAWALDYGSDYCRLMRDFEHEDETVGLFIERTQPGPILRLIVIGDSVRLYRGAQEIGYRMYPSGAPRTAQRLLYRTSAGHQYLNLGPTTLSDMAIPAQGAPPLMPPPYSREAEARLAAGITGIALNRGLTTPVLIETGNLEDAARALQACADDLVASWGLDAEAHKSLDRPAMPVDATAGWISGDTIAFEDFSKLSGGHNEVRMLINQNGEATSCHIQWPTLDEATNQKICASIMENSAFRPALDREGQPVDSYWTTNVFFLMPPFGGS